MAQAVDTPGASRAPGGADPLIELMGVHKRLGRQQVFREVNLSLNAGETTVVIGESGMGKSVLLKHIVGLMRPDRGHVLYRGERIEHLPDRRMAGIRRDFGFLFQLSALFDSMSAGDNVAFPLAERTDKRKAEIKRIVDEKLRMVGLAEIGHKMPAELSGGQKKRVALARAIALDPSVILYDEPTTGLDPVRADTINELILKLKREMRVTSIVVTHDMASAFKVADRIVMLHEGEFIFDGTCDEIRACADERVSRFIEGRADADDLRSLGENGS